MVSLKEKIEYALAYIFRTNPLFYLASSGILREILQRKDEGFLEKNYPKNLS